MLVGMGGFGGMTMRMRMTLVFMAMLMFVAVFAIDYIDIQLFLHRHDFSHLYTGFASASLFGDPHRKTRRQIQCHPMLGG